MDRTPEVISRLLFERTPWDAIDDSFAAKIPFDSPHESKDLLRRMVAEKYSTAHRIVLDGNRIGLLITRCEEGSISRELVVQAAFMASPDGLPLSGQFSAAIDALAKAENCNCIRFHTCRPMAVRIAYEQFGYRLSEIVMRKTL